MKIQLAKPEHIDAWMVLVEQVRNAFPGLEIAEAMAEHRATVLQFMQSSSAICAVDAGNIVGTLAVLKENSMLCFLAVGSRIQKTAYCPADGGFHADANGGWEGRHRHHLPGGRSQRNRARAFYKCLGFSEGKLTEEFGCPVQEFVLKR